MNTLINSFFNTELNTCLIDAEYRQCQDFLNQLLSVQSLLQYSSPKSQTSVIVFQLLKKEKKKSNQFLRQFLDTWNASGKLFRAIS